MPKIRSTFRLSRMRRRMSSFRAPKRLRRPREVLATRPASLTRVEPSATGVEQHSAWIRAIASALAVTLSLWVVSYVTGVPDFGRATRDLNFGVDLDPTSAHDGYLVNAIEKGEIFVTVSLDTQVMAKAPAPFGELLRLVESREPSAIEEGQAKLTLQFWRDRKLHPVEVLPNNDHKIELLVVSDREIQPADEGNVSIKPVSVEGLKSFKIFNRFSFGHPYLVTVTDGFYLGPLLQKTLSYDINLRFASPLNGQNGLAQFEWHQAFRVMHSPTATFGAVNRVNFLSRIDDVRTLTGAAADVEPAVRTYGRLTEVSEVTADTEASGFEPLEVTVRGTDTGRKDLVDFVVFGMAAVFGAAASVLFESALSALTKSRSRR
ncbi:hypothetical protein AWB72_05634 [Caballeronia concitans]|uniref:Uncharacterized protein n=1 Tax=Caballeronia concitans TaxID=1777133 RepID=A0A658R6D8_9BURK|nr:hypothetical protein AWB72_05634 [Caballeronia concitans]